MASICTRRPGGTVSRGRGRVTRREEDEDEGAVSPGHPYAYRSLYSLNSQGEEGLRRELAYRHTRAVKPQAQQGKKALALEAA